MVNLEMTRTISRRSCLGLQHRLRLSVGRRGQLQPQILALLVEPVLFSVATTDGSDSSDSSDAENEDGGSNSDSEVPVESAAS